MPKPKKNAIRRAIEAAYDPKKPLELSPEFAASNQATPKTPAQVLEELQAQLAERNLPEADVVRLIADPCNFLAERLGGSLLEAQTALRTIASLYFATLHRKAVDGEAFTEGRLKQALIEARIRALEALAQHVQFCSPDVALKIAELVSKD